MGRMICCISANLFFCSLLLLTRCEHKAGSQTSAFTKADSVTEGYLALQDTMLQVWNTMIYDDNQKIRAMHLLLDELKRINPEIHDEIQHLRARLEQLGNMRYDQSSIKDAEVVSEYDFASNSLVSEILSLAESQREFARNETLQKLSDAIRASDQRVMSYRQEYDSTASRFNAFIEQHRKVLEEIDSEAFVQKRPLFEMAAE